MPCHAAMNDKFLKVLISDPIDKTLAKMDKQKTDFAIVTDKKGRFEGIFKIQSLFKNLLPVSIAMPEGLQANVRMSAAPGIAKRLKKVEPLALEQFIERNVPAVQPETPLWVAVKLLVEHAGPIVVIDADKESAVGVMNTKTVLDELNRLKDS